MKGQACIKFIKICKEENITPTLAKKLVANVLTGKYEYEP